MQEPASRSDESREAWIAEAAKALLYRGQATSFGEALVAAERLFELCCASIRATEQSPSEPMPGGHHWPQPCNAVDASIAGRSAQQCEEYFALQRVFALTSQRIPCETPEPLRADISRCVATGLLTAERIELSGPAELRAWRLRLTFAGEQRLLELDEWLRSNGSSGN